MIKLKKTTKSLDTNRNLFKFLMFLKGVYI